MEKLTAYVGNIAAALGILAVVLSVIVRLSGFHVVGAQPQSPGFGLESGTLFEFGVGMMVLACLAKIQLLGSK